MAEVFRCPSCSGKLEFDGGDHVTVRCEYCGNTVIVPESIRSRSGNVSTLYGQQGAMQQVVGMLNEGRQEEAAQLFGQTFGVGQTQAREAVARLADGLTLSSQHLHVRVGDAGTVSVAQRRFLRRLGCVIAAIIVLSIGGAVIIPLVAGGAAIWSIFSQEPVATGVAQILSEDVPVVIAQSTAQYARQYASLVDSFGSEGIGSGQFVDPRGITIASDGQIFVADYSTGRVQRFDAQVNSLGVWQWEEDRVIQALSAGAQDDLYAIQGGQLVRFDRESGEALGALTYESDRPVAFRDVAVAPNGEVVALNHFSEFVRYDAAGNVVHVVDIEEAAEATGAGELALDGVGNVYLLATYEDALGKRQNGVFLFSNEGRYLSRFGSDGDEPGQFTSPSAIAIDGQGRIYVSDFPGIITFSNSGTYLGTTDTEGFIFGMDFDNQGQLVAVGNANKLFRYALPPAE